MWRCRDRRILLFSCWSYRFNHFSKIGEMAYSQGSLVYKPQNFYTYCIGEVSSAFPAGTGENQILSSLGLPAGSSRATAPLPLSHGHRPGNGRLPASPACNYVGGKPPTELVSKWVRAPRHPPTLEGTQVHFNGPSGDLATLLWLLLLSCFLNSFFVKIPIPNFSPQEKPAKRLEATSQAPPEPEARPL